MSQFKLLEEIVKKLTEKNIPYMLTGSLVSSLNIKSLFEELKIEANTLE